MGFYSLSNILYNLRKISKYILLSFCLLSFIIVCLLLCFMDSSVYATNILSGTYNQSRGYGSESSYGDRFDLDFTINSNGSVTISGTMGTDSNPTLASFSGHTFSINFNDPNYEYVFICRHHEQNGRYLMYRVPRGSTYYVYNANTWSNWEAFNSAFYCNQSYSYYDQNGYIRDYSAGYVDITNDFSSYAFGNCNTYSDSSLTTVLYNPFNPPVLTPSFLNYDDSTTYGNTLINGEFYNFDFKVYGDESDFVFLHDITEGQPTDIFSSNGINSSMIDLKEYYISLDGQIIYRYLKNIDNNTYYYSVPVTSFFGRYKNNTDYLLVLSYPTDSKQYTWTTSFSSAGITIQEENINTQIENSINNLNQSQQEINNFLFDNNYSSSNVLDNMPSSDSYTSPTDSGVNSIFTSLYNAFTNSEPTTVRFIIPFTNGQYIDIASDIVTSRLDSTILTLIQMFYWFMIARFIIKDIATYAQKAKSGAILDNNGDDNIKTDLL